MKVMNSVYINILRKKKFILYAVLLSCFLLMLLNLSYILTFNREIEEDATYNTSGIHNVIQKYVADINRNNVTTLADTMFVDEDELFISCDRSGYLDTSTYPLVDAQMIFCGDFYVENHQANRAYLNGLTSLSYAKDCTMNFMDCELYIQHSGGILMLFNNVTRNGNYSLIEVGKVFAHKDDGKLTSRLFREHFMFSENNHLYFLPNALSTREQVLRFLRLLASRCMKQKSFPSKELFINVSNITIDATQITTQFCLLMEMIGGSVRQAYVIGPHLHKPSSANVCNVDSLNIATSAM